MGHYVCVCVCVCFTSKRKKVRFFYFKNIEILRNAKVYFGLISFLREPKVLGNKRTIIK